MYSQRLTQYWPEFKDNGKEVLFSNHRILFDTQVFFVNFQGITVADLLRHEAGFANFPTRWQLDCPPILFFRFCLGTVARLSTGSTPMMCTSSLTKPQSTLLHYLNSIPSAILIVLTASRGRLDDGDLLLTENIKQNSIGEVENHYF